ncbi:hypothetical protein APHAL10511_001801 [Amanita phalloides]|nr:hypothetical protein APHAL10511_001801 [Amanita phalloides]
MSRPPVDPEKSAAGIIFDPQTLERIVPESKRADGSKRKEIKIRPGFTPQEDIRRFRSTKQQQIEANALPKGRIIGWTAPSPAAKVDETKPLTKSAKKNAKRKEKRAEKKPSGEAVPESWDADDDDDDDTGSKTAAINSTTQDSSSAEGLADKLEKLKVDVEGS